jgi:hypothetical protein
MKKMNTLSPSMHFFSNYCVALCSIAVGSTSGTTRLLTRPLMHPGQPSTLLPLLAHRHHAQPTARHRGRSPPWILPPARCQGALGLVSHLLVEAATHSPDAMDVVACSPHCCMLAAKAESWNPLSGSIANTLKPTTRAKIEAFLHNPQSEPPERLF